MSPRFHRSLVVGFSLALAALLPISRRAGWRALGRRPAQPWPAAWTQPGVASAEQAKWDGLFWCPRYRAAMRVLQEPALFSTLFPGYEAARGDRAFWRDYFQADFDQANFSSVLVGLAPAAQVYTSWLGNIDLFARYGADVAIFGISDAFVGVNPGFLQEELGAPRLRILQLAKGNLFPESLAWTLRNLTTRQKARLAIWGYSPYYARHLREYHLLDQAVRCSYRKRAMDGFWRGYGLDRRFSSVPWPLIAGPSLESIEDARGAPAHLVPASLAARPRELESFLSRQDAGLFSLGLDDSDCDTSRASKQADAVIAQLLRLSDKALIYLAPLPPLARAQLPACYLPALKRMLLSKAGGRVAVDASDWEDYGLAYSDLLYPTDAPDRRTLDGIHLNEDGAAKVTAHVARRAAALLPTGLTGRPERLAAGR